MILNKLLMIYIKINL